MDPREERSARILRDTLFELAATRDIATITPSELARETGLARRTIYNHGEGPQELLFGYLAEELTAIRDRGAQEFAGSTAVDAFEVGLRSVLEHVQNHRAIFARAVSATTSPAWHHMLTQHFTVSLAVFSDLFPPRVSAVGRSSGLELGPDARLVLTSSIAHGMVGAIEAWLRLEDEPGVDFCHGLIMALTPDWFIGEE